MGAGWVTDSSTGLNNAIVSTYNGSSWTDHVVIGGGVFTSLTAQIVSVSCASPTFCAVGGYYGMSGNNPEYPFVATWNGDQWRPVELATQSTEGQIYSVSCTSSTFCVASGYERPTGSGTPPAVGFASIFNGNQWSDAVLPNSSEALAVNCTTSNFCAIVGQDSGPTARTWIYNGSGFHQVDPPSNLGSGEGMLTNVSCVSATFCAAGGWYYTGVGLNFRAFVSTFDGSNWTNSILGQSFTGTLISETNSVSCVSSTFCAAVSQLETAGPDSRTFTSVFNGVSWSDQEIATGIDAGNNAYALGISCIATNFCVTAGATTPTNGGPTVPFVSQFDGSTWTDQLIGQTLPYAGSRSLLGYVSCVPPGFCATGGEYATAGNELHLLVATSQSAPTSPTNVTASFENGQATVAWTAPAYNGSSPITSYTVTASAGGATCSTSGATTCVVIGLHAGLSYTFTVTATNALGTSAPSDPSIPVPSGLAATGTSSETLLVLGAAFVLSGMGMLARQRKRRVATRH